MHRPDGRRLPARVRSARRPLAQWRAVATPERVPRLPGTRRTNAAALANLGDDGADRRRARRSALEVRGRASRAAGRGDSRARSDCRRGVARGGGRQRGRPDQRHSPCRADAGPGDVGASAVSAASFEPRADEDRGRESRESRGPRGLRRDDRACPSGCCGSSEQRCAAAAVRRPWPIDRRRRPGRLSPCMARSRVGDARRRPRARGRRFRRARAVSRRTYARRGPSLARTAVDCARTWRRRSARVGRPGTGGSDDPASRSRRRRPRRTSWKQLPDPSSGTNPQ